MRYEVFTLGKHYLQVHTSKGFTLFANAKLDTNGNVVSYSDKLVRRGGSWVIDTWKFLTIKYFPENPIYCAVFGFDENDTEVIVNATDIDVESISGVNGQLVDVGNISLPVGQSLPVNDFGGLEMVDRVLEYEADYTCLNPPKASEVGSPLKVDALTLCGWQNGGMQVMHNVATGKISTIRTNPAVLYDVIGYFLDDLGGFSATYFDTGHNRAISYYFTFKDLNTSGLILYCRKGQKITRVIY